MGTSITPNSSGDSLPFAFSDDLDSTAVSGKAGSPPSRQPSPVRAAAEYLAGDVATRTAALPHQPLYPSPFSTAAQQRATSAPRPIFWHDPVSPRSKPPLSPPSGQASANSPANRVAPRRHVPQASRPGFEQRHSPETIQAKSPPLAETGAVRVIDLGPLLSSLPDTMPPSLEEGPARRA